jgi:hypothetical protein
MTKPKDSPGILRLRAADAGPRLRAGGRVVVQAFVAPPQVTPPRKPKRPVPEQAALFE